MSLLVDTSVWSLAFRRDTPLGSPEVSALRAALQGGEQVFITGLVLEDVLQGFAAPNKRVPLDALNVDLDLGHVLSQDPPGDVLPFAHDQNR